MKKALLVLMVVVAMGFFGCDKAAEAGEATTRGSYQTFNSSLTTFLNETNHFSHTHDYDKMENPMGIGLDLKLFDFTKIKKADETAKIPLLTALTMENKYDFNNENYAMFVVLEMDLSSLWQK